MVFEGIIIVMITWYAWKWPTQEGAPVPTPHVGEVPS